MGTNPAPDGTDQTSPIKSDIKGEIRYPGWIKWVAGILFGCILYAGVFCLKPNQPEQGKSVSTSWTRQDGGQLGDFMGGLLNPALSLFTIIILFYNVDLQRKQVRHAEKQTQQSEEKLNAAISSLGESNAALHETSLAVKGALEAQRQIADFNTQVEASIEGNVRALEKTIELSRAALEAQRQLAEATVKMAESFKKQTEIQLLLAQFKAVEVEIRVWEEENKKGTGSSGFASHQAMKSRRDELLQTISERCIESDKEP